MKALKKVIALLLLAMASTTAIAVTDAQVFAYAEANYPSLFTGSATTGQYQQYNYRYYPASGNYLAVDTAGVIFVLGPFTSGVVTAVGPVSAYANTITAWEATQAGAGATGEIMGGGSEYGTAAQYFTKNAVGNTWSLLYTGAGMPTFTTTGTITAFTGGVVTNNTTSSFGSTATSTSYIDATGALVANIALDTSIVLPATFSVGTTWVQMPATASQGAMNATIAAFNVTRTVPAGTFTDCLQINIASTTTNASGTITSNRTEYLSPSAGSVVEMTGAISSSSSSSSYIAQLQAGYIANP